MSKAMAAPFLIISMDWHSAGLCARACLSSEPELHDKISELMGRIKSELDRQSVILTPDDAFRLQVALRAYCKEKVSDPAMLSRARVISQTISSRLGGGVPSSASDRDPLRPERDDSDLGAGRRAGKRSSRARGFLLFCAEASFSRYLHLRARAERMPWWRYAARRRLIARAEEQRKRHVAYIFALCWDPAREGVGARMRQEVDA